MEFRISFSNFMEKQTNKQKTKHKGKFDYSSPMFWETEILKLKFEFHFSMLLLMKSRISACIGKLQRSFHILKIVGKFSAEYNRVLNLKKLIRNYIVL